MNPEYAIVPEQREANKFKTALRVLDYIRAYEARLAAANKLATFSLGARPIGADYSLRNPQIEWVIIDSVNEFLREQGGIQIPVGNPNDTNNFITLQTWLGRKDDDPRVHSWRGHSTSPHVPQPADTSPPTLTTYSFDLEEALTRLSTIEQSTNAPIEEPARTGMYL